RRALGWLDVGRAMDGGGHGRLGKKLRGVVQFLQECASLGGRYLYDFDQLRRKLGLTTDPPAQARSTAPDIANMGAAELAGLAVESLTEDQLELAYQTAQKLDARELAAQFARALVDRPANPERPDRYAWYSYLVQQAVVEDKHDEALQWLAEGERFDSEHNESRRARDYELRRAQVLAKRGEAEQAQEAFDRLIGRTPPTCAIAATPQRQCFL